MHATNVGLHCQWLWATNDATFKLCKAAASNFWRCDRSNQSRRHPKVQCWM